LRTPRLPLVAASLAAAVLALPAAAQAKLPSFAHASFTANVGVGGAKLGQGVAAGLRAWGGSRRGACDDLGCIFDDPLHPELGSAVLGYEAGRRGKITKVVLTAGFNRSGRPAFKAPLASLRGAGGIHLGSSESAVRKAYPKAKPVPGQAGFIGLRGRHGYQTFFGFQSGRLIQIVVEDGRRRG